MTSSAGQVSEIAERFVHFAEEARGSSALYAMLSRDISDDHELLQLLLVAPPSQRRPNLLFAAAHDLLLEEPEHDVARYYASVSETAISPDEQAFKLFRDFCLSNRSRLRATIATRHTQTNEVRRSAAFVPIFQRICAEEPIALVEVGASAGLNLLVDRFRFRYDDGPWIGASDSPVAIQCNVQGRAPPTRMHGVEVACRIGIDTRPLDVSNAHDARWLMACVWPEQRDRLELLRSVLDVARSDPPQLVKGDAIEVLEEVALGIPPHLTICLFNSATLCYFTDAECAAFVSVADRIARERELHWLSLEGGTRQTFGARLPFDALYKPRSTDRPTDIFGILGYARWRGTQREDRVAARADMHGRWIEWMEDL
jgi:hypothetical protein